MTTFHKLNTMYCHLTVEYINYSNKSYGPNKRIVTSIRCMYYFKTRLHIIFSYVHGLNIYKYNIFLSVSIP